MCPIGWEVPHHSSPGPLLLTASCPQLSRAWCCSCHISARADPILDYATIGRRVSVPVIICIILGLLICLLLALLARQMQSARARHRGRS